MTDPIFHLEIAYPDPVSPGERKELVKGDWGAHILDTNMFGFRDYKNAATKRGPKAKREPKKSWGFMVSVGESEMRRIASIHRKFAAQPARPGTTGNPLVINVAHGRCFFD